MSREHWPEWALLAVAAGRYRARGWPTGVAFFSRRARELAAYVAVMRVLA